MLLASTMGVETDGPQALAEHPGCLRQSVAGSVRICLKTNKAEHFKYSRH